MTERASILDRSALKKLSWIIVIVVLLVAALLVLGVPSGLSWWRSLVGGMLIGVAMLIFKNT